MPEHYTTADAAKLTGASRQIIRTYTSTYQRFFSTEGSPETGQNRRFTAADLKLIRFIYERTSAGVKHDAVISALLAGELEQSTWQPPEEPAAQPDAAEPTAGAYLVPIERLLSAQAQAAQAAALLTDAQRREAEAIERERELQSEVQRLNLELGKAQGEAAALRATRYKAPAWWRNLFGGRSNE